MNESDKENWPNTPQRTAKASATTLKPLPMSPFPTSPVCFQPEERVETNSSNSSIENGTLTSADLQQLTACMENGKALKEELVQKIKDATTNAEEDLKCFELERLRMNARDIQQQESLKLSALCIRQLKIRLAQTVASDEEKTLKLSKSEEEKAKLMKTIESNEARIKQLAGDLSIAVDELEKRGIELERLIKQLSQAQHDIKEKEIALNNLKQQQQQQQQQQHSLLPPAIPATPLTSANTARRQSVQQQMQSTMKKQPANNGRNAGQLSMTMKPNSGVVDTRRQSTQQNQLHNFGDRRSSVAVPPQTAPHKKQQQQPKSIIVAKQQTTKPQTKQKNSQPLQIANITSTTEEEEERVVVSVQARIAAEANEDELLRLKHRVAVTTVDEVVSAIFSDAFDRCQKRTVVSFMRMNERVLREKQIEVERLQEIASQNEFAQQEAQCIAEIKQKELDQAVRQLADVDLERKELKERQLITQQNLEDANLAAVLNDAGVSMLNDVVEFEQSQEEIQQEIIDRLETNCGVLIKRAEDAEIQVSQLQVVIQTISKERNEFAGKVVQTSEALVKLEAVSQHYTQLQQGFAEIETKYKLACEDLALKTNELQMLRTYITALKHRAQSKIALLQGNLQRSEHQAIESEKSLQLVCEYLSKLKPSIASQLSQLFTILKISPTS